MRKFALLLVSLLLLGAQMLQAQRTVTGTVISTEDKQGIPMATIQVKGTTVGTTTDLDGRYTINVPPEGTHLIFTFMGMATQEIALDGKTTIDVAMAPDATALEGVEIVGYGSARKVGTAVGSVQQVTAKKLEAKPVANVLDALQGQVAGLQVYSSSGDPTETQSMRLHGTGSLSTSSTPLYIVDGIQVAASSVLAMNPNDFESMTILKDASATSIYGARAANGVVVITTKRGIRNSDARVVVRSQWGISKLAERGFYDMMSTQEYLKFYQELGFLTPTEAAKIDFENGLISTNWIDVFMRDNVPTTQTDVSVQGGSDKTVYFVSGNHTYNEGTAYGNYYKRYTARTNVESQAKDWLKVGLNATLSRDERRNNTNYDAAYLSGGLSFLLRPYESPTNADGSRKNILTINNAMPHPEYMAEMQKTIHTNSQLIGGFFVEITPLKGLKFISRSGTDARQYHSDGLTDPRYEYGSSKGNGGRSSTDQQLINMTTNNVVEYAFDLNKVHNITAMVGQEGILYNFSGTTASQLGIQDYRQIRLGQGSGVPTVAQNSSSYAFLSFLGRLDYGYDDRFYADFSLRRDASSRFGAENRSAWFWAVGGRWNMKGEDFLKSIKMLTDASVKLSYGIQGNSEIGNYAALALTSSTGQYQGNMAWAISNPGNPGLSWESQSKLTFGFRAEFNRKYTVEVDLYNRKTTDMLMSVPFPLTSGYSAAMDNVGSLVNRGIDVNLGATFVRTRDYSVGANLVFNYNAEKITKLFPGAEGRWMIPGTGMAYVEGEPVMFYYPMYAGVDPSDGRQMWYVPGENIDVTTTNGKTTKNFNSEALMQNTGKKYNAPIAGGFGLNGSYKGFSLSADFAFVLGKWMLDNTSYFATNPQAFKLQNQIRDVLDYWTPTNTDAKYPNWKDPNNQMQFDTHLLSNASFLRLKNLSLYYTLPKPVVEKTNVITNVRVFCVARNLLTFTKYMGIDPEVDSHLALGSYGNSKQYQIGVEITF